MSTAWHDSNVMYSTRRLRIDSRTRAYLKSLTAQRSQIWLLVAKGHLTRTLFGAILRRLTALSVPAG